MLNYYSKQCHVTITPKHSHKGRRTHFACAVPQIQISSAAALGIPVTFYVERRPSTSPHAQHSYCANSRQLEAVPSDGRPRKARSIG
eukprot:scaffold320018_cov32-Tisochrysis_lutea.AAC.3